VVCHAEGGARQAGQATTTLAWCPSPWLAHVAPGVVVAF